MADDVTRLEIADHLSGIFARGGGSRSELLAAAVDARPEIRKALEALPDRLYTDPRQIWEKLPQLPVGL
ncbi:hypothetical protein [Streptomyces sp. NPDC007083]|uniref:hypothetical protein n=1 Tax=unclassified Streptomyces TaxID=2593676 RepID=UPI00340D00D5